MSCLENIFYEIIFPSQMFFKSDMDDEEEQTFHSLFGL